MQFRSRTKCGAMMPARPGLDVCIYYFVYIFYRN